MMILNFLRMLSDLTFYASFAGLIAWQFGAPSLLPFLLLQSACFGLSAGLRKYKAWRMAVLLPGVMSIGLPWLSLSARLTLLPPALYGLYMAWKGEYGLSWDHQERTFSVFWKAYLLAAALFILVGQWETVLSGSLPYCILMLLASVVLLRTLRHDPSVYLQRGNQIVNLLFVAVPAAAAWLLSSERVLDGITWLLRTLYLELCAPVISAVLIAAAFLLFGLFKALGWLLSLFGASASSQEQELALAPIQDALGEALESAGDGSALIERIFLGLAILLGIFILFRLFRWLSQKDMERGAGEAWKVTRTLPGQEESPAGDSRPTSAVLRIRRQYRKFLKLYTQQGGRFDASQTSGEIQTMAGPIFSDPDAVSELRELYINARYHNQGTREDAARMKELYLRLKKD